MSSIRGSGRWGAEHKRTERVAEQLETLIAGMKPATKLPPAADLRQEYGVSYYSVRAALAILRQRGLIEWLPGKGFYTVGDGDRLPRGSVYLRIADDVAARIRAGDLRPGDRLTLGAVEERYAISETTSRLVLNRLRGRGLVASNGVIRPGAGPRRDSPN